MRRSRRDYVGQSGYFPKRRPPSALMKKRAAKAPSHRLRGPGGELYVFTVVDEQKMRVRFPDGKRPVWSRAAARALYAQLRGEGYHPESTQTCECGAYPFPHRLGSKCCANPSAPGCEAVGRRPGRHRDETRRNQATPLRGGTTAAYGLGTVYLLEIRVGRHWMPAIGPDGQVMQFTSADDAKTEARFSLGPGQKWRVVRLAARSQTRSRDFSRTYAAGLTAPDLRTLRAVESGFAHSEDPKKMRGWRAAAIERLASRGLVRRVKGRYGDRWVVTTTGSYALGTFDSSRMRSRARRKRKRQ